MKKASIVIIIVAISMIVIGTTVAAVSIAKGAKFYGFFNRHLNKETQTYDNFSDITDIDIDLGAASLEIKEGTEFKVIVNSTSKQDIEVEVADGELRIREKDGSVNWFWEDFFKNNISSVEVYVPSGFEADRIVAKSQAGIIVMDSVASKSTDLETNAGEIKVKDIKTEDLNIKVAAGKIGVEGIVIGNINIECNVGSVDLDLEGNVEDYTVKGSVSFGEIKFNNTSYGGIDSNINFGDGDYDINIDCDAGDINIKLN